ncbi:MAG: CBS domain-containing protein [Candidatus Omnitrophica bacterium]|nr:CBS domain-containing protein [Candidatus Omnitrophota bacterium]
MIVKDIMSKKVYTVGIDMDVHKLAEEFIARNISGAPVVDADGRLLGLVLEEGILFQDKNVHLPTILNLSLGFVTLGLKQFEQEMKKITAGTVKDIMSEHPVTISSAMTIEAVATKMIETQVYYFPVVEDGRLIGVLTKRDIVRAIAEGRDHS